MSSEPNSRPGLISRILSGIVGVVSHHPRISVWLALMTACAGIGYAVLELKLPGARSVFAALTADTDAPSTGSDTASGSPREYQLVISAGRRDPQLLAAVVADLEAAVRREPDWFSAVATRVTEVITPEATTRELSEADIQRAIRVADYYKALLGSADWRDLRLDVHAAGLRRRIADPKTSAGSAAASFALSERLAESLRHYTENAVTADASGAAAESVSFRSPWLPVFSDDEYAGSVSRRSDLLMNADETVARVVVMAQPESPESDTSLARLRSVAEAVRTSHAGASPALQIRVTGEQALEADNNYSSVRDLSRALLIAFAAVGALLSFGFRSVRHPMLILLTLLVSLAWTAGLAALVVSELSLLSLTCVVILVGLGVDYGIHLTSRYLHFRQELFEADESLVLASDTTGSGILTSALTTAIAFAAAGLLGDARIAEIGIVTAAGLMLSVLATFLVLPALIALSDAEVEFDQLPAPPQFRFLTWPTSKYPAIAAVLLLAGCIAVAYRGFDISPNGVLCRISYNNSMQAMRNAADESVRGQDILAESGMPTLLFAESRAGSEAEALQRRADFLKLPSVRGVADLASRRNQTIPAGKLELLKSLRSRISELTADSVQLPPAQAAGIGRELDLLFQDLTGSDDLRARRAAGDLDAFLDRLSSLKNDARQSALLDAYQARMISSLFNELRRADFVAERAMTQAPEIAQAWQQSWHVSDEAGEQWILRVFPRDPMTDGAAMERFVAEVRSVDPSAGGPLVRAREASAGLHSGFLRIVLYGIAAICLFLLYEFLRPGQKLLTIIPPAMVLGCVGYALYRRTGEVNSDLLLVVYLAMVVFVAAVLDFRNLRDTLIALLPAALGGAMLIGVMVTLEVTLTPISLIALPLILGMGVDDGIHLIHDCRRRIRDGDKDYQPSNDTLTGVVLTSLTSAAAFASLMIAGHEGLFSLGIMLALAMVCCLSVSVLFMPALLSVIARYQPAQMTAVRVIVRKPKADGETDDEGQEDSSNDGSRKGRQRGQVQVQRKAA